VSTRDLVELARRHVAGARADEQVEVIVGRSTSTSIKAYEGAVESFTAAENFGVGVRVIVNGRQSFAHAGSLDEDVIAETVAEARDNVGFGEPDEFYGLAESDGVAPVAQELWNEAVVEYPVEAKIELALQLERAVKAGDPRIAGVRTATYGDSAGEVALVTSNNIEVVSRATSCHVAVQSLATDGTETQTGFGVDVGRDPALLDIEQAAHDAVDRATRMLGATKAPSQRITLVVDPRQSAMLLGIIGSTLTGDRVLKGRSPFSDRVGESIASSHLTLIDDPTDSRSLAADTYDGEGLANRRNVLIEDGVLHGFLHNSYTGRRAATASTGSAVRSTRSMPSVGTQALAVRPGDLTEDELVAGIGHGFYLQSMAGLHSGVNPVSGDFSVGAEGLMIRDGALAEPIREVTIASTLQRLLQDIEAVASDLEWLPSGSGAAALVIGDVSLSGT